MHLVGLHPNPLLQRFREGHVQSFPSRFATALLCRRHRVYPVTFVPQLTSLPCLSAPELRATDWFPNDSAPSGEVQIASMQIPLVRFPAENLSMKAGCTEICLRCVDLDATCVAQSALSAHMTAGWLLLRVFLQHMSSIAQTRGQRKNMVIAYHCLLGLSSLFLRIYMYILSRV